MTKLVKRFLRGLGYELVRPQSAETAGLEALVDLPEADRQIAARVRPFTMASLERTASLINAIDYLVAHQIPGDIAECGVWRGGSMMAAALALQARGDTSRALYLYDTFEGMSDPTEHDKRWDGAAARTELAREADATGRWCYASIDDVRANLDSTGYPEERIHLIKGKVEETIPATIPARIALLRLDTDWYESTRHELIHLFPRVEAKGIVIIDDYGWWQGARKAVDEYLRERQLSVFLHRIDNTARLLVKNGA